jgi:hypothetical protein
VEAADEQVSQDLYLRIDRVPEHNALGLLVTPEEPPPTIEVGMVWEALWGQLQTVRQARGMPFGDEHAVKLIMTH